MTTLAKTLITESRYLSGYDPRPPLLYMQQWFWRNGDERAAVCALGIVLELIEEGFAPARKVFYTMKMRIDREYAGEQRPLQAFSDDIEDKIGWRCDFHNRAVRLGLVKLPVR